MPYYSGELDNYDDLDYIDGGRKFKPKPPWWKFLLQWLAIGVMVVSIGGSCYWMSTIPGCMCAEKIPDSQLRLYATTLGKKLLSCSDIKAYITGRCNSLVYIAVTGCGSKVMLRCNSEYDGKDVSTAACRSFSDVMPGEAINPRRRSNGSGKYYTEWWELSPK